MSGGRRRGLERQRLPASPTLQSAVSQQRSRQSRHSELPGYGWASLSSQPLVLRVETPLSCVSLWWSIVGSPQHASPGRQTGAAAEACRRNSKVAGSVEDGDEDEKPIGLWGGSVTKSDTLSRLSLIQAFWRVGRILGDEFGSGTRHGSSQAWWRINGAPELRARKQGFDKSSRKIGCRDQ